MPLFPAYTSEDHQVWSILFKRQQSLIRENAPPEFLSGLDVLEFSPDCLPDPNEISLRLQQLNGWQLYPVEGIVPNTDFFNLLAEKKFPVTTWIRSMQQCDYLEEPDLFHDLFGHVPLLAEENYGLFLHGLGNRVRILTQTAAIELFARLYWYTIEFGLIQNSGRLRIYGSGILSSAGESAYALSGQARYIDYNLATIIRTPYVTDTFQNQYFVIESFEKLYKSLDLIDRLLTEICAYSC